MSDDKYNLRAKDDEELIGWIAGWKQTTEMYLAGMQELQRRRDARMSLQSWIAIGISVLSLIVAVIALLK